jgi:putative ABC transport system substrate-binding protein
MVRDGGFAQWGIDYVKLGKQTADMAIRVLNGAAISDTPVEVVNVYARMSTSKMRGSEHRPVG